MVRAWIQQGAKQSSAGAAASAEARLLTAQRRNLLLMASIERGTRWLLFAPNEAATWRRAVEQLRAFAYLPLADD